MKGVDFVPDSLQDLFDKDQEAYAFFQSLPMFVQDQIRANAENIQSKEELSGMANNAAREALMLDPYKPMFEDETDSKIDLQ